MKFEHGIALMLKNKNSLENATQKEKKSLIIKTLCVKEKDIVIHGRAFIHSLWMSLTHAGCEYLREWYEFECMNRIWMTWLVSTTFHCHVTSYLSPDQYLGFQITVKNLSHTHTFTIDDDGSSVSPIHNHSSKMMLHNDWMELEKSRLDCGIPRQGRLDQMINWKVPVSPSYVWLMIEGIRDDGQTDRQSCVGGSHAIMSMTQTHSQSHTQSLWRWCQWWWGWKEKKSRRLKSRRRCGWVGCETFFPSFFFFWTTLVLHRDTHTHTLSQMNKRRRFDFVIGRSQWGLAVVAGRWMQRHHLHER